MIALRVEFQGLDTLSKNLSALEQRVLPNAIALTVNRIGLQFQRDERERISKEFTLRRPDFSQDNPAIADAIAKLTASTANLDAISTAIDTVKSDVESTIPDAPPA